MDYGYGSQYNAQGGGGGGFMAGEASASPSGGRSYAKETLRPVTVKQILDATQAHPDADFKIDGAEISQLTFVGQVRNISSQTTNVTYKIDDGTGEVEVKQWMDSETANSVSEDMMDIGNNDPNSTKPQQVVLNGYARVFGKMKSFSNKRHVGAHVIRPLTDLNEVHCHLLEATAVHLFFTRGPPPSAEGAAASNAQGTTAAGAAGGSLAGPSASMGGGLLQSTSPTARKLYQTLANTAQTNEGLHVQNLAAEMGTPVADVYKASEELLSSGLIFTTVDENTWAVLEAC